MPVTLTTWRSTKRRLMVKDGIGIKREPISIKTNAKRAGGVDQVVKYQFSRHEALSVTPSYHRKKSESYRYMNSLGSYGIANLSLENFIRI
jgi:hypothetical protein